MPICPSGHASEAADYCDVCGDLIGGAPAAEPGPGGAPACPHCGTPRSGRFCEVDGYDFDTGTMYTVELAIDRAAHAVPLVPQPRTGSAPVAPPGPHALVAADRAYFDSVVAELGPGAQGLTFRRTARSGASRCAAGRSASAGAARPAGSCRRST
jgi:hypothetical protein